MDPLKQRIAIAELRGWTGVRLVRVFGGCNLVLRGQKHFLNAGIQVSTTEDIPDYLNDLNAIHEVEIDLIVNANLDWTFEYHLQEICSETKTHLTHATATQRCYAVLKTLEKWEES